MSSNHPRRGWWHLPALALAFTLCGSVAVARAQTVMVRNAPPGTPVELVVNAAPAGSATVDSAGEARLPTNLFSAPGRREMDARVSVDVCGEMRRILVVEPGQPALPEQPGCTRTEITGVYVVRRSSWLVVNLQGAVPTMMLLQREYGTVSRTWSPAPAGVVVFGGWGVSKFSDAALIACGNVTPCTDGGYSGGYSAGAAFWFTRYTAAEASYVKPGDAIASGSGATYRFNGSLETQLLNLSGLVGVPAGPVRFYGKAGANHAWATTTATQTIDDRTVTVNGVDQVIAGGTQTNISEARGWAWTFGGGIEAWVTSRLGIYGEFGRTAVKGTEVGGGEGVLDDRMTSYTVGARLRVW